MTVEDVGSLTKKQKTGHGGSLSELRPDVHRPLSIGLTTGDTPPGFDWGSESEEDGDAVVVLQTPEVRQLREKKLQTETVVALKKCRLYDRHLDWVPFLKSTDVPQQKSAVLSPTVVPKSTMTAPSVVVITPKSVVVESGADNADVIIVKEPVPVVEKKSYDLMDDLLEPPSMLSHFVKEMNVSLMEYMRTEYDGLYSRIETSETRINKILCDKSEEQD